jgi:hypothetical protein
VTAPPPVLRFVAVAEAATGLALLVAPSLVVGLLIGESPGGAAVPVARVAGLALVGLGIACWPGPPVAGLLAYSAAVSVYLAVLGLGGAADGVLLWPAVALHAVLSVLLAREWRDSAGKR